MNAVKMLNEILINNNCTEIRVHENFDGDSILFFIGIEKFMLNIKDWKQGAYVYRLSEEVFEKHINETIYITSTFGNKKCNELIEYITN